MAASRKPDLPTVVDPFTGETRRLGTVPSDPRLVAALPVYGGEVLPESELAEFNDFPDSIKIKDQNGKGACFPAGTRVRMVDGSERPIEAIRLLDEVVTAEGNVGRVVRMMARDADDGLVRLMLWSHSYLRATAEHPILTKRGYIPAGELTLSDWVARPDYIPDVRPMIYDWLKVQGIEREDFEGPVYNLEVEGDNSYVAEGIGVHNCNGHATAGAAEQARFVMGMDQVDLSGWYPYAILCNGQDVGSNILHAYKLAGERGLAPESTVDYGIINPRKLTAEAHEAAKRFRLEFGASYQSWRQVVSGVMLRENINLSVHVDGRDRFNTLDREGVAGAPKGQGNHAVCVGLGLKKSSRWGWLVLLRNSWSTAWGDKGFCWIGEAHIEAGSYFEAFSVKGIVDDPTDEENPPLAKALAHLPKRSTWKPSEITA